MSERIMLWPHPAPYTDQCGDQAQPSLKAYPAEGSRGAVVVLPGGGYQYKADHEGGQIARMLTSQGISAYVLDYRVCPCPHDAPLSDARRAIRVVRSLGYEKVGVLGFSAGGHLCCSAAVHFDEGDGDSADPIERISSRPDAFIPCYPVVTMGKYTHKGSRQRLLGGEWENEELVRFYSNELQVKENTPPAFIWHTAEDGSVPVQNSLMLAHALADKGILFELHVFPKGHHGLGLAPEYALIATWGNSCCRWLLEMGFGK